MMHPFTPKAALRMPLVALIFAIALIAAGCGGGNSSAPTPFNVTGTVENTSATPLSDVTVTMDGNAAETGTTNNSGVFSLAVLPANLFKDGAATQHTLTFSENGQLVDSVTVTATPAEATATGVNLGVFEVGPPPAP